MQHSTQLFIPIISSPTAALLAATGIAEWLADLGERVTNAPIQVHIADVGHSIVVQTPTELHPEKVNNAHYQRPLAKWILTAKNGPAPSDTVGIIDYEAERQHNADYYEALKQLQKGGMTFNKLDHERKNELEQKAPRPFWPVAAMLNQMSAISAYNKAVERWADCRDIYPDLVDLIWMMCSGQPHALPQAETAWQKLAKTHNLEKSPYISATQVVNPEQGKGANRAKADILSIGGQNSFWLLEYFKFVGLYNSTLPRIVQGKKDRKTYVVIPSPEGIAWRWHQDIFGQFQKDLWTSSAVKMDIQAVLRYTAVMLTQWEGAARSTGRRRTPSDYISGVGVITYKDLGSAFAVMNVATIGLPYWINWPSSSDEAQYFKTVIESQQKLINALDESHGEEEKLLRTYRDFISSRDPNLHALFDFTTGYAGYTLSKMSKRQYVQQFTIHELEAIIMALEEQRNKPLKPIFDTVGFQRIATAIRQSTVTQQFYKTNRDDTTYDIRYGLASELQRHARDDHDFMRALGAFLQEYSQENARVMERNRGKPYRRRIPISTEDIAQVAALVDEYHAPTIANLLVAFGYARDSKVKEDENGAIEEVQVDLNEQNPF